MNYFVGLSVTEVDVYIVKMSRKTGAQKLVDAEVTGWLAEESLPSSFFLYLHLDLCLYCASYIIQLDFLLFTPYPPTLHLILQGLTYHAPD